jgi:phage shock protein PspC (stress-responsive transcriptional regulator)
MELIRPKRGRVIAGVCVAVANRFGWNPTVVRILTLLSLILPGPQVVLYIILWIVIPGEKRG